MENKYYTPEIEEFSVNFEYEFHGMTTGGLVIMDMKEGTVEEISKPTHKVWSQERLSLFPLDPGYRSLADIEKLIGSDQIRVKYLDKDDIENLEGKYFKNNTEYFVFKGRYRLVMDSWDKKLICISDIEKKDRIMFIGEVKNKSELKRILKQVML